MKFDWYRIKAESNPKDHGVSFEEAATVFDDPSHRMFFIHSTRRALLPSEHQRKIGCWSWFLPNAAT
ncbi:MAG: hypothetical protein ABIU20_04490 [Blastocatellia bacterium]